MEGRVKIYRFATRKYTACLEAKHILCSFGSFYFVYTTRKSFVQHVAMNHVCHTHAESFYTYERDITLRMWQTLCGMRHPYF